MKGQVLGFDGATGAITGEDGTRYAFAIGDWKGERPPQPRDNVDFVVAEGTAREIYLLKSALSGFGGGSASGAGGLAFFATRPQVIVEALVILIVLLFPFVSGPMGMDTKGGVSAISFPGKMNEVAGRLSEMAGAASAMSSPFGAPGAAGAAPSTGWLSFVAILSYLLIAIPLIAAFAIFRDAVNQRMKVLELVIGGLCIGSLAIYLLNIGALKSVMGPMGGMLSNVIRFGVGGYLLMACGVVLVLTGLGKIARTPGM